ncbi:MAG: type II toxin-antitoxin system VapC family toxin [Acidimicrobiales bacterium]
MRVRNEQLAGPELLPVEVFSVLRQQRLRERVSNEQAAQAVQTMMDLPVRLYPARPLLERMWQLRDTITAYDAAYVALAEALGGALLTADVKLSQAPGPRCPIEVI